MRMNLMQHDVNLRGEKKRVLLKNYSLFLPFLSTLGVQQNGNSLRGRQEAHELELQDGQTGVDSTSLIVN